jgi:hypothetical protein
MALDFDYVGRANLTYPRALGTALRFQFGAAVARWMPRQKNFISQRRIVDLASHRNTKNDVRL